MTQIPYYTQPFFQGLFFVAGIYVEKILRKKIYPKSVYVYDKQFKHKCRIWMMLLVTVFLMLFNYSTKCQPQGISPAKCFYFIKENQSFGDFLFSIISPLIANSILFFYHLYQRIFIHKNLTVSRLKDIKAVFWAPILEELLFRACFYRASEQKVSIIYLSAIFSLAHFHRFIWKKVINKKEYFIKQTLGQSAFTFVFGLYSFYFLTVYGSILSSIVLHCMCNFSGPPSFNKRNLKYHMVALVFFVAYLVFVV